MVSRFSLIDDGRRADPASEAVLLEVPRTARIHHCGHLEFGPHDGLLYLCFGDMQWSTGEIGPAARDPASLHGKILRLDPFASTPEPRRDSPLLKSAETTPGQADRPAVWLKGLRNPWRASASIRRPG